MCNPLPQSLVGNLTALCFIFSLVTNANNINNIIVLGRLIEILLQSTLNWKTHNNIKYSTVFPGGHTCHVQRFFKNLLFTGCQKCCSQQK